jgi:hypothetical protein
MGMKAQNPSQQIAQSFEASFLSQTLPKQMAECDHYEPAKVFLDLFKDNQPGLEAGCGSGRWCGWFINSRNAILCSLTNWQQEYELD